MEQKHGEGFEWFPARVNMLLELKKRGYSAAQIAKQIGGGVTRSAVIGKLDRMGVNPLATRRRDRSPEKDYGEAQDAGNKGKGKALDLSPPELLAVRRFSWERADAQPHS